MSKNKIVLPALRGRMGDWIYYISLMQFSEIANRVSMVPDIHKSKGLSRLIQREVTNRSEDIVDYLINQEQRFFNSLILGIYGGKPSWQEIEIKDTLSIDNERVRYLNKTFGILTLNGNEEIFAIDGQHRTKAIIDLQKKDDTTYKEEEVSVIFIAHKKTHDGEIRTRRLFSTLNRYAKPVNLSEIIAIDEEDNCAIITRNIVESFSLLEDKISFNKNRSISRNNTKAFTNIIILYDIVKILLTNQNVIGIKVSGDDLKLCTHKRRNEEYIFEKQKYVEDIFTEIFNLLPCLSNYISNNEIDRTEMSSSLLFRPIGQIVFFSVLKIAIDNDKKFEALEYFKKDNFNLSNPIWNRVFWNSEIGRIKPDKSLQNFAIYLILKHLKIKFKERKKDKENFHNFDIDPMIL